LRGALVEARGDDPAAYAGRIVGIVGCGYVADFCLTTLRSHPELEVVGQVDHRPERVSLLAQRYGIPVAAVPHHGR
jgi:predicted dehydrogenase